MNYGQPGLSKEAMFTALESLLKSGKSIELKWDCGGDEAFIFPTDACKELSETHKTLMQALEIHLLNILNLPDAGEFSMTGKGQLSLEDDKIVITFESIMKGFEYYKPKTKEGGWKEVNAVEPMYSGKKIIFQ